MVRKSSDGNIHLKIVFYGPSPSGKTTSLKWMFENFESLKRGGFTSIEDPGGRTLYFDYTAISAGKKIFLDVYTTAGRRRYLPQRKIVLQGVDGLVFIADSSRNMQKLNIESLNELKEILRPQQLGNDIPFVLMLNKRDLPDAMSRKEILTKLDLPRYPTYETIAIKGLGLKRAFQSIAREVLLRQIYKV